MFISVCQPEGPFIEWKAEEVISLDGPSEQDWDMISSVGYQPDRGSSDPGRFAKITNQK